VPASQAPWKALLLTCGVFLALGCHPTQTRDQAVSAEAEARHALDLYVLDFWVKRDTTALQRALSPDMTYHYNGRVIAGRPANHLAALASFGGAFPDLKATVDVFVYADSLGGAVTTWTGTHTGVLCQTPGAGQKVSWVVNYLFRMSEGRIVELWEAWDEGGIYRTLGIDHGKC
jgi:predicted ester cyclase